MLSRQLLTFIQVAETGSFSKAAERLYITKASVMNQINVLEDRIGVCLMNRTSQGIVLTRAGEALYQSGKCLAREAEQVTSYVRKQEFGEHIIIRVGSSTLYPAKRLIHLWNRISREHPEFRIQVVPFEDDYRSISTIVSNLGKKMDVLLGSCDDKTWFQACKTYELGRARLSCAVPFTHRLAKKDSIRFEDLFYEDLLMVPEGISAVLDQFRKEVQERLPEIHLRDTRSYYDMETFNECASGSAVLLSLDIWADVHPFLKTIPLETEYQVPCCLMCPRKMSVELQMYVKYLLESLRYYEGGGAERET